MLPLPLKFVPAVGFEAELRGEILNQIKRCFCIFAYGDVSVHERASSRKQIHILDLLRPSDHSSQTSAKMNDVDRFGMIVSSLLHADASFRDGNKSVLFYLHMQPTELHQRNCISCMLYTIHPAKQFFVSCFFFVRSYSHSVCSSFRKPRLFRPNFRCLIYSGPSRPKVKPPCPPC